MVNGASPIRWAIIVGMTLVSFSGRGQAGITSEAPVDRSPRIATSHGESSRPGLRMLASPPTTPVVHPLRSFPRPHAILPANPQFDGSLQTLAPLAAMPAPLISFAGLGDGNPASFTVASDPPDTNGAVGPNHYVQIVNSNFMIWDKSGQVVQSVRPISSLWSGYTGTNPGNGCGSRNDGDPVALYDQIADRWFISQFSLPNEATTGTPNFQCIAVSKTSDPTGGYWLYDFQYTPMNDYPKFGVWPDAYYGSYNAFDPAGNYLGSGACAYDRSSMLAGLPATQVCFQSADNTTAPYLPVGLEGQIRPPAGTPGFFVNDGDLTNTTLGLYKLHVDWTIPANSTFTGPTLLSVDPYTWPCSDTGRTCIPQPSPGNQLDSLGDRLMFPATYRNFGALESIIVNRSVSAGASNAQTGIRWFEVRSPRTTPSVFQQGTFAPADTNHRFMGSLAQNQAQDFALGYSVSGPAMKPAIAWTGRTPADPQGMMGQSETIVRAGTGVETGTLSGVPVTRWGDYSRMAVDPSDDCTFWYTNEVYDANGIFTWQTQIASVKFGNCGANNFSLAISPPAQVVAPGSSTTFTVSSAVTAGSAESIALSVQDLPLGVTASFAPPSISAGGSSTLTLSAAPNAPATALPVTFTVIGKATSAAHTVSGVLNVGSLAAPLGLLATAQSKSQINISWGAINGATYQLFRKQSGGDFTLLVSPTTNSYADAPVASDSAFLYKVRAVIGVVTSADSNIDLATTTMFTDDPLIVGTTVVRAVHVTELRTAISAVANLAGTGPLTFTDSSLTNVNIKSVHVTELRSDLNTARVALGLAKLSFANSAATGTKVAATDFTELRNGVK